MMQLLLWDIKHGNQSSGRALPGRETIVVSSRDINPNGVYIVRSVEEAIQIATHQSVYGIGGKRIFEEFLPLSKTLHLSHIPGNHDGDTYFPEFDANQFQETKRKNFPGFTYSRLERK
jgi:dihydrofolate reductase